MLQTESKFLKINNFNLHYEVFDGLVDQDTILIHGNLACNLWWYPTVEELQSRPSAGAKKGKLVLADWRGCGLSKGLTDEDDVDFSLFADDYLHLIEALNLKNISVIGHSTGGLIGMLAILKQSAKFSSLVLLDSIGPLGIETPIPLDQLLGHFEAMSLNEDVSNATIAATIQNVDVNTDYFKTLAKSTFSVDRAVWKGVPKTLCTKVDITKKMSQLKLPILILHGENDMVLPKEGSEKMHTMLPNSELQIVKGQGHSLNVENPKLFVSLIENFWSKL
jgi:branched-chain amino acid transport system permease protein